MLLGVARSEGDRVAVVVGVLSGLGTVAVIGALLFGCAGRADLPMFWAYLGVWMGACLMLPLVVDAGLIRERLRPGPGGKDYAIAIAVLPLAASQFAAAGLDVGRYHWSDTVPPALRIVGLAATAAAFAVMGWAMVVNRFFSSVIRIQTERGHHVVTNGPYRFVRHPAYAVAPFLFVGSGLALGSWLATLIGTLLILPVVRRARDEDRVLRDRLPGYADYAAKVRYRLLPRVW